MFESKHERVLDSLRRGTSHHLKGNFGDTEFSALVPQTIDISPEVTDNMWSNCNDCVFHAKCEDVYVMFNVELKRHVNDNIMSKIKCIEETEMFEELVCSWTTYTSTVSVFRELFSLLDRWIEKERKEGIKSLGLTAFIDGILSEKEIVEKLASVGKKRTGEIYKTILN